MDGLPALLTDFRVRDAVMVDARTPLLMRWAANWALSQRLGRKRALSIVKAADHLYIPPPPLAHTRPGRSNLVMAAYLLALRDACVELGEQVDEINQRLADDLCRVMRVAYAPLDGFATVIHPFDPMRRTRFRQRFAREVLFRLPDWQMEGVGAGGGYGFDIRRCVLAEYMRGRGEARFCSEVICVQDLLMAQSRGEQLVRTKTIAAGDDRCDFRFMTQAQASVKTD